jgi:hypothetical protein
MMPSFGGFNQAGVPLTIMPSSGRDDGIMLASSSAAQDDSVVRRVLHAGLAVGKSKL